MRDFAIKNLTLSYFHHIACKKRVANSGHYCQKLVTNGNRWQCPLPPLPERAVDEDDVDGGAEAGDGLDLQHVGLHLLREGQLLGQLKRSKVVWFRPTDQTDLEPIELFNVVSTIAGLNFIGF